MTDKTAPENPARRAMLASGVAAGAALPFAAQASQSHGLRDPKPFSSGPSTWRVPQGWRGLDLAFYEMSGNDPEFLEIYGYCDAMSYAAGETVKLHASTTAETFDLVVWRDGPTRETVFEAKGVKGVFTETPEHAYANGCGWPVLAEIPVDAVWRSGVYIIEMTVTDSIDTKLAEAGFVLRGQKKAEIAYMPTTCTTQAYNMWGGANYYLGRPGDDGVGPTQHASYDRPFERGFWTAPDNFPYLHTQPERIRYKNEPTYTAQPAPGYPLVMGYAWGANSAGWALDNRPLAIWAEENGYEMEYIDQTDLGRIDGYDCVIITGHDEYWSWDQRDALDAFVEAGGNMARFAANMLWQARMEGDDGRTQVCYKVNADEADPVAGTDRAHMLTTIWEHASINRPAAQTFSVTGLQGIYAAYDGASPRSSGGFTIYRPGHWAFEGTARLYGDTFGMEELHRPVRNRQRGLCHPVRAAASVGPAHPAGGHGDPGRHPWHGRSTQRRRPRQRGSGAGNRGFLCPLLRPLHRRQRRDRDRGQVPLWLGPDRGRAQGQGRNFLCGHRLLVPRAEMGRPHHPADHP